jgi:hypothetical protein
MSKRRNTGPFWSVWSTVIGVLLKFFIQKTVQDVKLGKFLPTIVFNYTYRMDSSRTRTTVFMFLMMIWAVEVSGFLRRFISLIYLRSAGLHMQFR